MSLDGYMQLKFIKYSSDECGERKLRAGMTAQYIFYKEELLPLSNKTS